MLRLLLAILLIFAASANADTYLFILNRFGGIEIKVHGDRGEVKFFQGNKEGPVFTSRTQLVAGRTASGVRFDIQKLKAPVIRDFNRHINSGNYRLRITGEGSAFRAMEARLPLLADFAATGEPMTFYGEKTQ
jgi:hypothetical protein